MGKGVISKPFEQSTTARIFFSDFPTGSPYVTSIGATILQSNDGSTVSAEEGASIGNGAIITTGGGFGISEQGEWQKDAVSQWATGSGPKPPSWSYDASTRGYPDATLAGHNYQVYYHGDDGLKQG